MTNQRNTVGPWIFLLLGVLGAAAIVQGCDSELFDDQIWPIDETREECFDEPDSWRCNGEVAELCRNGWWNPWYNCAWNGGTCEVAFDEDGVEIPGQAGCVDPPDQHIACSTDLYSTDDPDTEDTDTGPFEIYIEQVCSMCDGIPVNPVDFEDEEDTDPTDTDHPMMPGGATDGVLGCCSATDSNAYWGVDAVVMQSCTNGCCAWIDYTSTTDDPDPIRHGCCE